MKTKEEINERLIYCKAKLIQFKNLKAKEERILGLPSQYNNSINTFTVEIQTLKWILK